MWLPSPADLQAVTVEVPLDGLLAKVFDGLWTVVLLVIAWGGRKAYYAFLDAIEVWKDMVAQVDKNRAAIQDNRQAIQDVQGQVAQVHGQVQEVQGTVRRIAEKVGCKNDSA